MLAVLLMLAVAGGIAWPFAQKWIAARRETELAPEGDTVTAGGVEGGAAPVVRTREELCPSCSRLNPGGSRVCWDCGAQMPVTNFKRLFDGANKEDLTREGIQSGLLLFGMIIAMATANFLPVAGKILILFATVGVLGWRVMRGIQA